MEITPRQLEIIEAASKILTSSGVSGLTIKNLAKEMKFSESAIYRHFISKEEILVAMMDYLSETMDYRLQNTFNPNNNPEEKFKSVFKSLVDFFILNPQFVVAVFSDGLMEESQRINQALLRLMNVIMKHLVPVISEGQGSGVFTNNISIEEMLHIVIGAFKLQMLKWKIANFRFDIEKAVSSLMISLLILIKNK